MHPAYSVIFFTTASGAGYGLLFWLGLSEAFATGVLGRWTAFAALCLALLLITAGLLSSTFHLGHPERAHRAFSQWRSSWLSREGVAAVATYVPASLLGLAWLFGLQGGVLPVLALLAAVGAAATVFATGMIYASLRTIRQWNRADVPWIYLVLSAATGALLFGLFAAGGGIPGAAIAGIAILGLALAALLKRRYWAAIDADPGRYTRAMALGLPDETAIQPLDPPHTMPNFVMREMGFSVARKHAEKLRRIVLASLFGLPILLVLLGQIVGLPFLGFLLGSLCAGLGLVVERWLFFAEAEHVSQLYYGRNRA